MLTARKRAFVDYYKTCWNGAESVRRLGYKGKNANRLASQLLSDPDVKAEIAAELATLDAMADQKSFVKVALREFDSLDKSVPIKPRYLEMAGRALGYLRPEETNINVSVGFNSMRSIRESLKLRGKEINPPTTTSSSAQNIFPEKVLNIPNGMEKNINADISTNTNISTTNNIEITPPPTNPSLDNNTLDTRSTESPAS